MFDPQSAFEEQPHKNEIQTQKDWKTFLKNKLQDFSLAVIGLGFLLFLILLPLIFDFGGIKWYAKILMFFGSLVGIYALMLFSAIFSESIPSKQGLLWFSPLFFTCIAGIVAYFDFELWGCKTFIVGLLFVWAFFVVFFFSAKTLFNKVVGSENAPIVLIATAMLTFFIAIVNKKTDNSASATLYFKVSVGIIYLVAVALYVNKYIYKKQKETISNIIGVIFWGATITISFPFYIQWCGLTENNLTTFVSVYSALLGGGITLAGVAWTIQHTNKEKKENEIKAIRPFVYPFNAFNDYDGKQLITLQFSDGNVANTKSKYIGMIKNTDNGIFILKELVVDGERFFIKYGDVLDKNSFAQIILFTEKELVFDKVALIGTDVRGYVVGFNVELNEEKKEIIRITEEQIDG